MRVWLRRLAAAGAVLLLVAAVVFLVPTVWGKPWSIDHFFTRVFLEFALERPVVLSQLRILEPYGIDFHSDDLDDYSLEFEREELREVARNLEILRRYDRDSLSGSQRLSADVLEWFLEIQKQREAFLLNDYPVNQMNGIQNGLPDLMLNVHQIRSLDDAEDYVARLEEFERALGQVVRGVRVRSEAGTVPPRFVLAQVRSDIAEFLAPAPGEHFLVHHLERSLDSVEGVETEQAEALAERARAVMEESVYPAYRRLDDVLAPLQAASSDDAGAWKLPNGAEYYAWALRRHTTTELPADRIHELGLAEVARIGQEMRAILRREGIAAESLPKALASLRRQERFRYSDTDAGREEILADYRAIIDDARERLPALVGRLPEAGVEAQRVPEFMEQGAPLAYYDPPPFDGSKPGIFFVNLRNVREHVRYRMRTLAHHETLPGHHLQISLAMQQEELPFFRRVLPFTAFTEGWALYAERLAGEQGFLPTDWDRLGMLVDEMFRAVRLVVDTGIHARRWTRERAIDYMVEHTGKPRSEVVAEVDRYVVLPGQACAYKVGELEILRLREEARGELGDAFDLREFHDVVLGHGAVPLEILERIVRSWIEAKTSSA